MSWVAFGMGLVRLLLDIAAALQQQRWYQEGVKDANAKAELEEKRRIAEALAAGERAAPDGMLDPNDRDNEVH